MRTAALAPTLALWLAGAALAADDGEVRRVDPLGSRLEEQVEVRLVILDAVVVDGNGRTVADLRREDFEIRLDGKPVAIDTLDVDCPGGTADDPRGVGRAAKRGRPGGGGARIVLAIDYQHVNQLQRVQLLAELREQVLHNAADEDEIMLVALTGGLRVEQAFTRDKRRVLEVLERMEFDISLWQPPFLHLDESGFIRGMEALLQVLEPVPGPKAIVLYSAMGTRAMDDGYARLATLAASSRSSIYPVDAVGLESPLGDITYEAGGPPG